MTPTQYREHLKALGLTMNGAARLFKVHIRSAHRWGERGSDGPPEAAAIALRLMLEKHEALHQKGDQP